MVKIATENLVKIVKTLLINEGQFVSGESLSEELGVSRAAVKKMIDKLVENGYGIEARTGLGYRLFSLPSYPEENIVNAFLDLKGIHNIVYFFYRQIESTQDEAVRFLARKSGQLEKEKHYVFLALEQLKGRGRFNRKWFSSQGGLWFTLVYNKIVEIESLPYYSLAPAITLTEYLNDFYNLNAMLKWPNDVVVNGKKIAGVLASARVEVNTAPQTIIGVGLNINNEIPDPIKEVAVSLKELTGREINALEFFINLLVKLVRDLDSLIPGIVVEKANRLLWKKGEIGLVSEPDGKKIKALIKEVGKKGELICEVNGRERSFFSAEIDYF